MAKQIIHMSGITLEENASETFTLPDLPISKVIIKKKGAPTGTTYNANTYIKSVKVKLNGREFEDWSGDVWNSGSVPSGIGALREFQRANEQLEPTSERIVLDFPDALPANLPKTITIQANDFSHMGDTITAKGTVTFEIAYEIEDLLPNRVVVRKVHWNKRAIGAKPSDSFYLEGTDNGFACASIAWFITDGDGTTQDNAITAAIGANIDIEIYHGSDQIFSGTWADLIADHSSKAGIAPNGGWAILPMELRKFNPNQVRVLVRNNGYATYNEINLYYYMLQLAEV
ncbi:hypothetical protein [Candidatus Lokiarchaeum ossiferum]|uniref:hypothetical protein n=1 Tax=Candidatus Lokiarchaeum ossiferum TaxID=2951803 RepID=UPI00352E4CB2